MQVLFTLVAILFAVIFLGIRFYNQWFSKTKKCDSCAISKSTINKMNEI